MSVAYLLDTNILLYAISSADDHAARKAVARQWMARSDWGVSTQVLLELYHNASKPRHGLGAARAAQLVGAVAARYPVQSADAALVAEAMHLAQHRQISLWDAAILCAARRLGAHTVVSEDLNHGQVYDDVRVLNPFAQPQLAGPAA